MKGFFFDKMLAPTKGGGNPWPSYWSTRFPSAMTCESDSDTQVTLSWTNNGTQDYDQIMIEQSLDDIDYSEVATANTGDTSKSITGLSADTLYYFRLRYRKGVNYSSYVKTVREYGPELVVDGGFDDTSKWMKSAGVVVSGGKGVMTVTAGETQYVYQVGIALQNGVTYRIAIKTKVTNISGVGMMTFCWGPGNNIIGAPQWTTDRDIDFTAGENTASFGVKRYAYGSDNSIFEIDDFSVKKKF